MERREGLEGGEREGSGKGNGKGWEIWKFGE